MDSEIIHDFFVKPIISPETQGYNLVNTSIYIILLVIACALIYTILKKKIKFDYKFFISILPYVLFGVSLRVVMHQIESGSLVVDGITKTANPLEIGFWFFTPGIWILTFALVVIGLIFSGLLEKNLSYKRLFWFGAIIVAPVMLFNFSRFDNWIPFVITAIFIAIVSYGLCFIVNKFTKYKILSDKLNLFIIAGQGIDGIASAIAIAYFGFSEQHVLSSALINIHPALFAMLKLILATLICWSLDDYLADNNGLSETKINDKKNLVGFIKVIIAILGFATGLASLFKLGII